MTNFESHKNLRLQSLVLLVGICLMTIKFLAYYFTKSNTILTDALESIVNVIAGFFTLYSIWYATKPKDEDHPYGHGKIEFISAGIEGALIFIAGVAMLIKSSFDLMNPTPIEHMDWGILLVTATALLNYILGKLLTNRGKISRSPALIASGKHLLSDTYTTLAMIVGLVLIYFTHENSLDSIIAIVMSVFIMIMSIRILRKSLAGIMDETDLEVVEEILQILNANRKEEWIDVHNLRVIKYGTTYHVDAHVTLPWYYDIRLAHDTIEELAKTVEENSATSVEFFIHTDPCMPFSCKICQIQNCKVREEKMEKKLVWSTSSLLTNHKHGKI